MASILTRYKELKKQYNEQIEANSLPPEAWQTLQEAIYRVSVLEGFFAHIRTAPQTTDARVTGYHFRLLTIFVGQIGSERKVTQQGDANPAHKTAEEMLTQVIVDGRRRFKDFTPTTNDDYKNCVIRYIETILCAWEQYRNTCVPIRFEEVQA